MAKRKFSDLRLNLSNSQSDNFWPSFADIMTVIVMIFLMVMVVLLIKNWDLIEKLKKSIAAEKASIQLIETTQEQKSVLEQKLSNAESQISLLRMQLFEYQQQRDELREKVEKRNQTILILQGEKRSVISEGVALKSSISKLQTAQERLQKDLLAYQKNLHLEKSKNADLRAESNRLIANSNNLKEEYSQLRIKYEKLIKPARTSKGKKVVEIVYQKIANTKTISIKSPGSSKSINVSEKTLHRTLSGLKKKYPNKLYVKIIFPKDSFISHKEAWEFTINLLELYDYYYQK